MAAAAHFLFFHNPRYPDAPRSLPGNGLTAILSGETLLGGSQTFVTGQIGAENSLGAKAEDLSGQGKTPLLFAREGRLLGMIAVADAIKPDSPEAWASAW